MLVAATSLAVGAGLSLFFMYRTSYGVAGIAFGSSLAAFLNTILHVIGLDRRLGITIVGRSERVAVGQVALASIVAASAGLGILRLAARWHPIPAAAAIYGVFGLSYLVAAALLGNADARRLARIAR